METIKRFDVVKPAPPKKGEPETRVVGLQEAPSGKYVLYADHIASLTNTSGGELAKKIEEKDAEIEKVREALVISENDLDAARRTIENLVDENSNLKNSMQAPPAADDQADMIAKLQDELAEVKKQLSDAQELLAGKE